MVAFIFILLVVGAPVIVLILFCSREVKKDPTLLQKNKFPGYGCSGLIDD